jgi:alkylated DNA nucleotide flippase Atl1
MAEQGQWLSSGSWLHSAQRRTMPWLRVANSERRRGRAHERASSEEERARERQGDGVEWPGARRHFIEREKMRGR